MVCSYNKPISFPKTAINSLFKCKNIFICESSLSLFFSLDNTVITFSNKQHKHFFALQCSLCSSIISYSSSCREMFVMNFFKNKTTVKYTSILPLLLCAINIISLTLVRLHLSIAFFIK